MHTLFSHQLQGKNIYLIGFMGTGKSSLAHYLSKTCSVTSVEMDEMLESSFSMKIPEIFSTYGESCFRDKETSLLRELSHKKNLIVSCGGGIVLREENISLMKESGIIILLTAEPDALYDRIGNDKNRPVLDGHRTPQGIASLIKKRLPMYQAAADFSITTDKKSISQIGNELLILLSDRIKF